MKRAQLSKAQRVAADPSHFTGEVHRLDLIEVDAPRSGAILVEFGPGGRTHWHSHPDGQYLYVVDGRGRIQSRGGAIEELLPGDCIYAAPGEEHWHGAAADAAVSHLAFSFGATRWIGPADEDV